MEATDNELEPNKAIELAAYQLWQQRGCPFGTPEVDWFQAEEQLGAQSEPDPTRSAMVTVAEAVGSALGSVAGIIASVGHIPLE